MESQAPQHFELGLPVTCDRAAVRITAYAREKRERRPELRKNPVNTVEPDRHDIAVGQKNPADARIRHPGPANFSRQFLFRPQAIRHALVHAAEAAAVVRAAICNLKDQAPRLGGRTEQRLHIVRRHLKPRAFRSSS